MPAEERAPGARGDLIMHAALQFGEQLLMGSDDPTTDEYPPVQGMMVCFSAESGDEAARVFKELADGGEVRLEIGATSFSPMFGMCVDRFGTPWMIDTSR